MKWEIASEKKETKSKKMYFFQKKRTIFYKKDRHGKETFENIEKNDISDLKLVNKNCKKTAIF
jgi:hypothetical protein